MIDECPCCRFSRTDTVGRPCAWCRIDRCRETCRRSPQIEGAAGELDASDPTGWGDRVTEWADTY